MDELTIREKLIPKIDNFKCYNSHLRIVNFSIYNEYVKAKREGRKDWADRASRWLCDKHGIVRTPGTLIGMLASIRNGSRAAISASGFIGDDLDPQSRYEKDAMYARFEVYIHEFLHGIPTYYVGLPANQLVSVAQKYNSTVACEREPSMAIFMRDLNRFVVKNVNVRVEPVDIFDYLSVTKNKFNVYDLDLMEALNAGRVEYISSLIKRTALDRAVIVLVSVGGRHITKKEYDQLMPSKFVENIEENHEWKIINSAPFCGRYKDIKMPMRFVVLVIEKRTGGAQVIDDDIDIGSINVIDNSFPIVPKLSEEKITEQLEIPNLTRGEKAIIKAIGLEVGNKELKTDVDICREIVREIATFVDEAGLTNRQLTIMKELLKDKTQPDIARTLGLNQSSVNKMIYGNHDYKAGCKYGGIKKKLIKFCEKNERIDRLVSMLEGIGYGQL